MSIYKYIYERTDMGANSDRAFINIHYLQGYCPKNLEYFQKMINDANVERLVKDCMWEIGMVSDSSYCDRFTIITAGAWVDKSWKEGLPEGWSVRPDMRNMGYSWS